MTDTLSPLDRINEDRLHALAIERMEYDDFGDDDYREGLGVLLDAARASDRLPQIVDRLCDLTVNALSSRLSSEAGWKTNPDVLNNPVTAPIVITGLPRSGTTLLHHLMSLDPQFQWTPRWIGEAPRIRPPRDDWESDRQYRQVRDRLDAFFVSNPKMRAAHDMGPDLADECITVMVQSFVSNTFISTLPLDAYRHWFYQADETPSYRRYKDNLRLIGAHAGDVTWLLKNPSHTFGMASLHEVFPDARVVILHRNPVDTIASGASLTYRNADFWRKQEVGPIRLETYARAVERMAAARRALPVQCLDVQYTDLIRDPMNAVNAIYRHYGLKLTEATETAMRDWLDANPQGKHGAHRYSAEEFGISDDMIRERFADYIARHDL